MLWFYSLRTALCESIRCQAKSEQNVRQDLIPRVRHGEAALHRHKPQPLQCLARRGRGNIGSFLRNTGQVLYERFHQGANQRARGKCRPRDMASDKNLEERIKTKFSLNELKIFQTQCMEYILNGRDIYFNKNWQWKVPVLPRTLRNMASTAI